ncbi:hypothetical protein GALMADRAFT_32023, partial [Galerina marginata CBS 339.88]
LHDLPIEPTEQTLSFFTVFMSSHIKPDSVDSYLSGIANQLEGFFPNVRKNRNSILVSRTLAGCKRRFGTPVNRKRPLSKSDILFVISQIGSSKSHDDMLFLAMITTGVDALLRLAAMAFPDKLKSRNYKKVTLRHTVNVSPTLYSFHLPGHKADRFFEGNTIIVRKTSLQTDPYRFFTRYLSSRDSLHPLKPELWLRQSGRVPTRSWFMRRMRKFFPKDVGGASMRAGGATALAEAGAPPHLIQAIGRWT